MISSFRGEHDFLSNFLIRNTTYSGLPDYHFISEPTLVLPSNEHYFQLHKASSGPNAIMALQFLLDPERNSVAVSRWNFITLYKELAPRRAKKFGRILAVEVPRGVRPDWHQIKDKIMVRAVMSKFWQHEDLRARLLSTGKEEIVEGNLWHDNYWGNCHCNSCKFKFGRNKLGKIHMATRNYFEGLKDVFI